MIRANADRYGSFSASTNSQDSYFIDDHAYIEHIKQKEIHEDLATNPLVPYNEEDFCKVASFPDKIGFIRASYITKILKKQNTKQHFVQIPSPNFEHQIWKQRESYHLREKQKKLLFQALAEGNIDVLVLSLTELIEELPAGISIAAITERKNPAYALVKKSNVLMSGNDNVTVPSLSLAQQLRAENTDFWCIEKSYNYEEAFSFLDKEESKGVVIPLTDILLAKQVNEWGLGEYSYTILPPQRVVPPAGQGSLCLLVRESDTKLKEFLYSTFHHHLTAYAFEWEKRAASLLDFLPEKSGSFLELNGKDYQLYLYNSQMIKPFHRLAVKTVGNRQKGVDLRRFNTLLHEVYGELVFLGLGPGSIRYLTMEAERFLRQAEVVYGMGSVITSFSTLFNGQCKFFDLEQDEKLQNIEYLLQQIRTQLLLGLKVAICLPGDPFFLNLGVFLSTTFSNAYIPFKVLAGLNPLLSLSVEESIPLIHPGQSSACHIFDGRTKNFLKRQFSTLDGTIVFYVRSNQISAILHKFEEEHFDPDTPCAYLTINMVGGKGQVEKGRLGSFFRKLGNINRNLDGYFIVGKTVSLSQYIEEGNFYEHPLSNTNVLIPVIKELKEDEQHWRYLYENLGANTIIYKLGTPIVTKKCKESLRQVLNHLTTGTLRMVNPVRVEQENIVEPKHKKLSPLKKFTKGRVYLVFHTSIGVEIFFKIFREEGYDLRLLAGYTFVAANKDVFRSLGEQGIHADYLPEKEDADYLAQLLLRKLQVEDYIISFSYEGKTSLFETMLTNAKMGLINIGIYVQQFRLPNKKQLLHFIDACQSFLFTEPAAAVGMISAMIEAGFDHDMILSRNLEMVATNLKAKEVLEASGFNVRLLEQPSDLTKHL